MSLSEKDRIQILMMVGYGDRRRSTNEVRELFNQVHPGRTQISQSTVCKILKKYEEHGYVKNLPKSGRPKIDDNIQLDVLLSVEENPHSVSRQIALDMGISHKSAQTIWHKEKYHPYKVCLVHELNEDDFDRRLQFCEIMQPICHQDQNFAANILFSDEATFYLNGTVNKQNCRYWSKENPRWIQEARSQSPEKLNVWAGILKDKVIGPFFFEGNLTGEGYMEFLQLDLLPALVTLYPDPNNPDRPSPEIWLQQDGAPPHYARQVREYLSLTFPRKWIGRRGPIEWPARSPDMTPLDFFLWGYLKSKVYFNRPRNIDELKCRITMEIRKISIEIIHNVQEEFVSRLGHCQVVNGHHFQHLLK